MVTDDVVNGLRLRRRLPARHSGQVSDATVYADRVANLGQVWQVWARLGLGFRQQQWSTPTRCPGWDLAALYAHHSRFPLALTALPAAAPKSGGEVLTAVEILRRFNAPGGAASRLAGAVAEQAVTDARQHDHAELVDRFGVQAPRAIEALRAAQPHLAVPWPAADGYVRLVEALRIALLEATVHLLDVYHALGRPPAVPEPALFGTAALLAEVAPAVELIEAATGRVTSSPLPVVR